METASFQPIAPRPAPIRTEGAGPWLKRNLFSNAPSTVATIVLLGLAAWWLAELVRWGLSQATRLQIGQRLG